MATVATNKDRLLELKVGSLDDKLLLINGMGGHEGLSNLFSFSLDLMSEKPEQVKAADILGQSTTITLNRDGGASRFFNGIVSRFSQTGRDERFTFYHAEVVPWLWFLTRTADCRIFQDLTVPEIVTKIFGEMGFRDFKQSLSRTYTKWDYCVQYRETDFYFVSRLLEQEGIHYFFTHESGKHTLVLADSPQANVPCPNQAKARFAPDGGFGEREDVITSWQTTHELRPGRHTLRDYHFEMPDKTLEVKRPSAINMGNNSRFEIYDYPGEYAQRFNKPSERLGKVRPEADAVVKVRMEEDDAGQKVLSGTSWCRAFTAGTRFELQSAPAGSDAGPYLLVAIQHSARQDASFVSGGFTGATYSNSFTCIPHSVPYRPQRLTPKPSMQGPQTAVVVGDGGEIMTDKFGRVKVQFHWDREGKKNENSSCWLRVAQLIAGKRWGAYFWPRVGQEVIIDFLEGDPEEPIIVGSVYNADQMPPYLGDGFDSKHANDNKVSGFKSNSTPGGEGFNEWRFDDTKDREQIFIHAQRDMDERVLNDTRERVIHDRHLIVGNEKDGKKVGDQREMVFQDKHLKVHRHHIEQIAGNMELRVGGGDDGGNQDLAINGSKHESIGGEDHLHVSKDRKQKIDGTTSLTVGGDQQEKVGGNHALEAGQEIHLKAGMKLILEAGAQLSLKGPGGFIDIGPAGVTIQGTMVLINSGGAAGSGSGSSPVAPDDAKVADPTAPDQADDSKSGKKSKPD